MAYEDPYEESYKQEYVSSHLWLEFHRDSAMPPAINRVRREHEMEWTTQMAAEINQGGGMDLPEKQREYIAALAAAEQGGQD